jgi:hypothetical protein
MQYRLPSFLRPFLSIATASVVWVIVGVSIAALIAACRIWIWVILSVPDMAATAAVLGAVQGLWLYLAGWPPESDFRGLRRLGSVSGGILGLLGFPPVFSRSDIVTDRLTVAVFLLAAICGGIAAGLTSGRVLALRARRGRLTLSRSVLVGGLLVLPLAAVDYRLYLPLAADRLPVPGVSRQAVTNISAGNARGSAWAGCYQFKGQFSRGGGAVGGAWGPLKVSQTDGALKVLNGTSAFQGGVDDDGGFRFGAEGIDSQYTIRVLWEGKFKGSSLGFTRRETVLRGTNIVNTTRLTGTAQRISCNP